MLDLSTVVHVATHLNSIILHVACNTHDNASAVNRRGTENLKGGPSIANNNSLGGLFVLSQLFLPDHLRKRTILTRDRTILQQYSVRHRNISSGRHHWFCRYKIFGEQPDLVVPSPSPGQIFLCKKYQDTMASVFSKGQSMAV